MYINLSLTCGKDALAGMARTFIIRPRGSLGRYLGLLDGQHYWEGGDLEGWPVATFRSREEAVEWTVRYFSLVPDADDGRKTLASRCIVEELICACRGACWHVLQAGYEAGH